MKKWQFPSIDLLDEPSVDNAKLQDTEKNLKIIIDVLKSHNIEISINPDEIMVGPAFSKYPLDLKSPNLISKIINLEKEITLALASISGNIRIVEPTKREPKLTIEIPNEKRQKVYFKTVASIFNDLRNKSEINVPMGVDTESIIFTQDLKFLPHLLMSGTTGSGKSQLLHNIILSLLFTKTPDEVKMILIDPKRIELLSYDGIPHLLRPVIEDLDEGVGTLSWAVEEMERRFVVLEKARVRTNQDYNKKMGKFELPDIVIIFDEYGDLMVREPVEFERNIIRIAQLGKHVGLHLILSVSRPSVETITGLMKANIPARVSFNVLNRINSIIIINQEGAEKLLLKGDMLFLPPDSAQPVRLQGSYISDKEIERVVGFLKEQNS